MALCANASASGTDVNVQTRYEEISKYFIWGLASVGIIIEVSYDNILT